MTRSAAAVLERPAASSSLASGTMGENGKHKPGRPPRLPQQEEDKGVDRAFDTWLRRGLHQLYDQVADEPLPQELLRLIEDDRNTRRGGK